MERFASFHTLGFLYSCVHLGASALHRPWLSMHFARDYTTGQRRKTSNENNCAQIVATDNN